jgi:hypothetical protein
VLDDGDEVKLERYTGGPPHARGTREAPRGHGAPEGDKDFDVVVIGS